MKACPSCKGPVSEKAFDCPSCGHPLRKPRRGFFGGLFKWTFILFNVLMLIWVVTGVMAVTETTQDLTSDAEMAGAAIGGALGFGLIATVWLFGSVILGMLVLFTRPRK